MLLWEKQSTALKSADQPYRSKVVVNRRDYNPDQDMVTYLMMRTYNRQTYAFLRCEPLYGYPETYTRNMMAYELRAARRDFQRSLRQWLKADE